MGDVVPILSSAIKVASVFALDPGETTGWAWCSFEMRALRLGGASSAVDQVLIGKGLFRPMFLYGEMECHDEVASARKLGTFVDGSVRRASDFWGSSVLSVLAIEDFVLRRSEMDRSLLSPVRLTARMEQETYGMVDRYESFSANDAKAVITDERLKRWKLWIPGKRHARDAVRQLLMTMRKMQQE